MKVVRIVSELDFGGVEQVLANSLPELQRITNFKLTVIVLGKGGRVSSALQSKGIQVIVWNQNPRIPNIKLLLKLTSFLKKHQPDVVHTQGAEANFHGLIAGRLAGVPSRIGEEIGFPNHHSYWKYIFKLIYKNATKLIAISHAVKDMIIELKEVEEGKVEVVYNPVEIGEKRKVRDERGTEREDNVLGTFLARGQDVEEEFNVSDKKVKPFVFVTTCRLVPVKNLDRLISVFVKLSEEFSEKPIELWIIGDGPLREVLENQSKELGISDKIKFWGFQENVLTFLEEADAFVLPSLSEGSSVSLVEAMTVGLPSIVTKVGGAREILGGSNSGLLIDPRNENTILKALKEVINYEKYQKEKISKNAIKEAKRFSIENYIQQIIKVYKAS